MKKKTGEISYSMTAKKLASPLFKSKSNVIKSLLNEANTRTHSDILKKSLSHSKKRTGPAGPLLNSYRTEPLLITPLVRREGGDHIANHLQKNLFLHFAPNVREMFDDHSSDQKKKSKEDYLREFFKNIGLDPSLLGGDDDEKKKIPSSKKEVTPKTWEVRAKLREFIDKHIEEKEEKNIISGKYPLFFAGGVDQKLSTKDFRRKYKTQRAKEKVEAILLKATEKENQQQQGKPTTEEKMNQMYQSIHSSAHKRKAPTRYKKPDITFSNKKIKL